MKVMTLFGTRPEMIKLWSCLRALDQSPVIDHIMVHTGQNFTPELRDFFFRDLGLRQPDIQLKIDTRSYGREVADVIRQSDELFTNIRPDALVILGDTYSGLSVMPATARGIPTFHLEAGLRAWDARMPETRNRVLIDHMSSFLLPFREFHRDNLIREGIHPAKIFVMGNPTFELMRALQPKIRRSGILRRFGLRRKKYLVATAHRSENVDDPATLAKLMESLEAAASAAGYPVVYPMHPRTRSRLRTKRTSKHVLIHPPLGFLDYQALIQDSLLLLSDSGTTPEEAYFYRTPAISLRYSTERPETVEGGGHTVAGLEAERVTRAVRDALARPWQGTYSLEEGHHPSRVLINLLLSDIRIFPQGGLGGPAPLSVR